MDLKESKLVGHQELVEYNLSLKEMEILLLVVCLFVFNQTTILFWTSFFLIFFSLKLSYMLLKRNFLGFTKYDLPFQILLRNLLQCLIASHCLKICGRNAKTDEGRI